MRNYFMFHTISAYFEKKNGKRTETSTTFRRLKPRQSLKRFVIFSHVFQCVVEANQFIEICSVSSRSNNWIWVDKCRIWGRKIFKTHLESSYCQSFFHWIRVFSFILVPFWLPIFFCNAVEGKVSNCNAAHSLYFCQCDKFYVENSIWSNCAFEMQLRDKRQCNSSIVIEFRIDSLFP